MKTSTNVRVSAAALLALLAAFAFPALAAEPAGKAATPADNFKISGPYTQENLTIFLIHGDDQLKGKNLLTLQEAMDQKKVVVHETQNVNQLSIENVSADVEVFVQ